MEIPSWSGTYYSNIKDQSIDKQNAYEELKDMWDNHNYIKISDSDRPNTAYFITYFYEVILEFIDKPESYYKLKSNLEFIINEYKNDQTGALHYGIRWLIDMAYIMKDYETVKLNAEKYLNNSKYWKRDEFPKEVFDFLNIKTNDAVDIKYFKHLFKTYSYLTEYGKHFSEEIQPEIEKELEKVCIQQNTNFVYLLMDVKTFKSTRFIGVPNIQTRENLESEFKTFFMNKKAKTILKQIAKKAENTIRKKHNVPGIGEGWVSETVLYKKLCSAFPSEEVLQHAQPIFLGQQHYDIYFPDHKIAIEYHGLQHFEPVDFFGGQSAFEQNVIRDIRKKKLSERNGIHLIVLREGYDFSKLMSDIAKHIRDVSNKEITPKIINHNEELEIEIKEKRKQFARRIVEINNTIKIPHAVSEKYIELVEKDDSIFKNYSELLCFQLDNYKYFDFNHREVKRYYDEFIQLVTNEKQVINYLDHMKEYYDFTQGEFKYIKNDEVMDNFNRINTTWIQPAKATFHAFYKHYEQNKFYENAVSVIQDQLVIMVETKDIFGLHLEKELKEKIDNLNEYIFLDTHKTELQNAHSQRKKKFEEALSVLKNENNNIDQLEEAFKKGSLLLHFEMKDLAELDLDAEHIHEGWLKIKNIATIITSESQVNQLMKELNVNDKPDYYLRNLDSRTRSNNNRNEVGGLVTKVFIILNKLKDFERAYEVACFGVEEKLFCYSGKSFQERKEKLEFKLFKN